MLNADSIGIEKHLYFVTKRLMIDTKEFFESVAKLQIALGIKSKKKSHKAISVINEDRQEFGVILGDKIDLSKALKYPITSIDLIMRNPDGTLQQISKNTFRNVLIDQSSVIQIQPLFQAYWIIDIKEWFTALIKIVTPNEPRKPESIEFVCDTYYSVSSKSCTHKEKGESDNVLI